MNRRIWLVALLAHATLTAQHAPANATGLDRQMMQRMAGRHESPHALVHYDPDKVTAAQRDAAVADIEQGVTALEKILGMRYQQRLLVFLYASVQDLQKLTRTSAVAFSTGTHSLHQAHDFRGLHELTHLFAVHFEKPRDAYTDLFVVEGLATMLAEHDQNVPIHDWATVYQSYGRLPDLLELRRTFPKGAPDGVHPYHVAGSFVGYLIDHFGIDKVKGYYVNASEAQHWFGKPFRTLEREWRAWLAGRKVEDGHRRHVRNQLGITGEELPQALREAKRIDLLKDGLAAFDAEDGSRWQLQDGVLSASHDDAWTHLTTKKRFGPKVAIRIELRRTGNAIKLQCNKGDAVNEAIFASWATYLGSGGGYAQTQDLKLAPDLWHELILVHDGGQSTIYLDGTSMLVAGNAPSQNKGKVGIAVERGTIEVRAFQRLDW